MKKKFYPFVLVLFLILSRGFSQSTIPGNPANTTHDSSVDTLNLASPSVKDIAPATLGVEGLAPDITFNEHPYNHNMHIASDGTNYYTINGGNFVYGKINKFDLAGALVQSYPIQIDGRGLSYNQADGALYASLYGGNVVKIDDLAAGTFTTLFSNIMQNTQASFAISTDGTKFYDFYRGTLKVHDLASGGVVNTITGLSYGEGNFGGEAAVAVDADHIYTVNTTIISTVYVYDLSGVFLYSDVLNSGSNGQSLSIANGNLFMAKDGNYNVGTWYGYGTATTLPVRLASFSVETKSNTVIASWQTASEVNTGHFIIQRSVDGVKFSNIGKVDAKGNSNTIVNYKFTDAGAATLNTRLLYYRLQTVDKNGSSTYSRVMTATIKVTKGLLLYPNPVKNILTIQINNTKEEMATIQVIDLQGKIIRQFSLQLQPGNMSTNISMESLPRGFYILKIKGEKESYQKFEKQ